MRKRYRDFYLVLESNTYYIISNVYSTFYRCSLTMHYDLRSLMSLRTMMSYTEKSRLFSVYFFPYKTVLPSKVMVNVTFVT